MRSTTDRNRRLLFDLDFLISLLDGYYPRLVTQIDRDPDSPTYGSCDRHFWMYRLNDFDSGVLQQASLTLAALDRLADHVDLSECTYLDPADRPYWRGLALAINRRNVRLLEKSGYLDEYYPGERSFPATVFAAYATLKSAVLLGQNEIIVSPALAATAARLTTRGPSAAANQDTACAAFLALYGKSQNWMPERVRAAVDRLLGPVGARRDFSEYGGLDLGYATVSLNYLAYLVEDGGYPAGDALTGLAATVADFVTPRGHLGGEFAARSTTYFLPFGIVQACLLGGKAGERLASLDLAAAFDKLDDRYLMHYCLPSLALTALKQARAGSAAPAPPASPDDRSGWATVDHRAQGLYVCRNDDSAVFIGLNKGGAVQAETPSGTMIDCGYRAERKGRVFATCVIDDSPDIRVSRDGDVVTLEIRAPFQRYASLVATPVKTVILRLLGFMGPSLNSYFKSLLIKKTACLPGAFLRRRIAVDFVGRKMTIEDEVTGLEPGDMLFPAPPWSFRLVPSARFYQDGEAAAFNGRARGAPLTERTLTRVVDLRS